MWGQCQNQVTGSQEVCGGKANDCDGTTDENLTRSCRCDPYTYGKEYCVSGSWSQCLCLK